MYWIIQFKGTEGDVDLGLTVDLINTAMSLFNNGLLAVLITARILYHQRLMHKLLGVAHTKNSPYSRVIAICVESCTLIIVIGAIYIALEVKHGY